jgi:hypothetical protein
VSGQSLDGHLEVERSKVEDSRWARKNATVAYSAAGDRTNDQTLEIANMKDGKTVGPGKTEVSKDGKSRTLETDGTLADGKKVPRQIHLREARGVQIGSLGSALK